jgi:hypothetical protein
MKKIWSLLLIINVLTSNYVHAQLAATLQVPLSGIVQKNDLWNMILVNSGSQIEQLQVQLQLSDNGTGRVIANGATRVFALPKGAKQIRVNDLMPVRYNQLSGGMDNTGNFLSVGSFTACYTFYDTHSKDAIPLAEECIIIESGPLTPPQLNMPADNAQIETAYPQFSWIPPAPLTMFKNLNYELHLVEIKKGQSAEEAIRKNLPVYSQRGIKNIANNYPASFAALQKGKLYAWQVIAKDNNTYAAKTEAWSFSVKQDSVWINIDKAGYAKLQQGTNAVFYTCTSSLKFEYFNETGDSTIALKFYSREGNGNRPIFIKNIKINPGQNFINEDVFQKKGFSSGEIYSLEVINSREEKWGLKFKYAPAEN